MYVDMLNKSLNTGFLRQAYQGNQAASMQNILEADYADSLYKAVMNLDWYLEISDYTPNSNLTIPLKEISNQDAPLLNVLDEVEHHLDRDNLFFMRLKADKETFTNPLLKQFERFLNSEAFLTPMREITGLQNVTHTWIEASCYQSCCFLGGHADDHNPLNRAAIVFNLTPHWELDWGGLLMLDNEQSHPVIIPPTGNSLSMFTVPREHLVSVVSPGAKAKRYSISGWLREGTSD